MVTGYLWGGGAEWHLLNLVWSLRKMGIQVDVAYLLPGAAGAQAAWRRFGIEPVHIDGLLTAWRLGRQNYDLIHAHLFKGEVAGMIGAWASGQPLVITRHSLDWRNLSGWQRGVLSGLVQRRCRGMIAISQSVADVCRMALAGRPVPIRVIPHGIAPDLLKSRLTGTDIRKELHLEGCRLIGTAARLSSDKGLPCLLQAYKQTQPALSNWHIAIAGDGPDRPRLETLAATLGIADRVHLLGWREDALDIVAALDIFALPSVREGFGLALLEAMTLGTAAVVSDLPGIRETAEDAAVYVPPADPGKLANALQQLASQPLLRSDLAIRGKQQARKFDAEEMARQTLAFYRDVAVQQL